MNKLFRKITFLSGAACSFFLISCQEEAIDTAIQPAIKHQETALAPPVMIAELRLSKFGNDTLIYNPDGRIKQRINAEGYSVFRTDYKYANNAITASKYKNDILQWRSEWRLENGRAVELKRKDYHVGGVIGEETSYIAYHYNNQNQLVKLLINEGKKRTVTLSYDNLGNVVKFLFVKNTDTGDVFQELVKFDYTEYVGSPTQHDKGSTINLHVFGPQGLSWMGDRYLPIFGKFGKSLLKKTVCSSSFPTYKYAYDLDTNGYVKDQKSYTEKGALIYSEQLKYVSPITDTYKR
jgi:hypothetical protein